MSVDVTAQVTIDRPRREVAAYMFDPANDAEWTVGVQSCRPIDHGRFRTGSKVERTVQFLSKTFSYLYEVVEVGDDDDYVVISVDEPFPMHVRYELEDAPNGTVARIRTSGDASGFFKLAGPLMAPMVRRNLDKDLAQLKKVLEG